MGLLDKKGSASFEGWRVPEHEVFEAAQALRRRLVGRLRSGASQQELDFVMEGVVRVSASTGALLPSAGEVPSRWAYIEGSASQGRFALHSGRSKGAKAADKDAAGGESARQDVGEREAAGSAPGKEPRDSAKDKEGREEEVPTLADGAQLAVEIDLQVFQLTLKASHPQALPTEVARLKDVVGVFGAVSMQACLTEQSAYRTCYRLVGRSHDIAYWSSRDPKLPPLDSYRAYYPEELFPSEKARPPPAPARPHPPLPAPPRFRPFTPLPSQVWLPSVLEPVRRTYMMLPRPLELYMQEDPLPAEAQLAYLVGKQPEQAGVWREIFVYRARRMVQVYRIESHGRRYYRSLEYCSDARFCLRDMQPSTGSRQGLWAPWERHGAGHPYADSHNSPTKSAVITRDWTVEANLSLGTETYIPARLLWGMIPATLLESHEFWQDEDDNLRGYPHDAASCTDIVLVRIATGAHVAFEGARFHQRRISLEDALPAARALVLRLKSTRLQRQRDAVLAALASLEAFVRDHQLLAEPFQADYAVAKALAAILRELGGHSFGGREAPPSSLDAFEELLYQVDLSMFARRRKRHKVSHVVLPALLDALAALMHSSRADPATAAAAAPAAAAEPAGSTSAPTYAGTAASSVSELEEAELVLLDLLHAPPDTYLYHLATVMARIENLSHVLAWAVYKDGADLSSPTALTHDDLFVVTLPRLKLTFEARRVGGATRLFSVDHADLFITNERTPMTTELLAGMPHSLLLSNSNGELSVLVPAVLPIRPLIVSVPFSTELVLDRSARGWYLALENPYCLPSCGSTPAPADQPA